MRPTSLSDLFRPFLETRAPLLFLVGSLALAILGNAVYELLTTTFGARPEFLIGLVITAALIFAFVALAFQRLLQATRAASGTLRIPQDQQVPPHPSLILPVGLREEGPERPILEWHLRDQTLRRCWLVASPQVRESPKLSNLRQWLLEQNVEVFVLPIDDERAIGPSYRAALEALDLAPRLREGLPVVVDITGGTAMMSVGLALAARERGIPIQYYPAQYTATGMVRTRSADAPLLAVEVLTAGAQQP